MTPGPAHSRHPGVLGDAATLLGLIPVIEVRAFLFLGLCTRVRACTCVYTRMCPSCLGGKDLRWETGVGKGPRPGLFHLPEQRLIRRLMPCGCWACVRKWVPTLLHHQACPVRASVYWLGQSSACQVPPPPDSTGLLQFPWGQGQG